MIIYAHGCTAPLLKNAIYHYYYYHHYYYYYYYYYYESGSGTSIRESGNESGNESGKEGVESGIESGKRELNPGKERRIREEHS